MSIWGARGSSAPTAKLNEAQVRIIKRLIRDGMQYRHIAALFGVAPSTIGRIAQGLSWGHIRVEDGD
jgi:uncharacterized protein YerC